MKKMTILILILSLQNMALAVEMAPAVTEDPQQVKAQEQKKEEAKQPIEAKREALKKKHANKKKNPSPTVAKPAAAPAASSDNSKIKAEDQEIKALNRDDQQQEKKDDKAPLGK